MNIQKILFPKVGRCKEEELYFHFAGQPLKNRAEEDNELDAVVERLDKAECRNGKSKLDIYSEDDKIVFRNTGKVYFDTYFNGFSIEKWSKYTVLSELSLKLRLSGRFRVTLLSKEKIHDDNFETVISETIAESAEESTFTFSYASGSRKGIYTFSLEALEDGSVFYGGEYVSDIPEDRVRNVKIGIGICTFRREAFIEKNLRILREAVLENADSPLYGHLEVFVSDNGKSLDIDRLSTESIHIFPNRNLGGAGGFTRNLIEMLQGNDERHITHALLMDDDIVIEPEALIKTFRILSLLRDEYIDAFIGGAMLRLDKQYMQVESGARWNGGELDSLKSNLDLRKCDSCLKNEIEETTEFNAWWYCCFPITVVREDNLPLPIFIRGDDLEYGLRNMRHLILMNGICVWHEPFENKYSSFLEYYIIRNLLIDNSFHCQWYGAKQLKRSIWTHCKQEIMYYRYKNVDLYIQGIKDFFKGPVWLMEQDGEALHKQVMAAGYKGQEISTLPMAFNYSMYEASREVKDSRIARYKRILTLNGLFLRSRGESIVPMASPLSPQFYRKSRVMHYDITSKKAFITERSVKRSIEYMIKVWAFIFTVPFKIKKAQEAYRTEGLKLRTLEFWKGFLELE